MKTTSNSTKIYSPFWALTAVFLTFIFLEGTNLRSLLDQRSQLQATHEEFKKVVPQALTINQTIENLGNDLLAMTNKEARQIIADFKIAPSNSGK